MRFSLELKERNQKVVKDRKEKFKEFQSFYAITDNGENTISTSLSIINTIDPRIFQEAGGIIYPLYNPEIAQAMSEAIMKIFEQFNQSIKNIFAGNNNIDPLEDLGMEDHVYEDYKSSSGIKTAAIILLLLLSGLGVKHCADTTHELTEKTTSSEAKNNSMMDTANLRKNSQDNKKDSSNQLPLQEQNDILQRNQ